MTKDTKRHKGKFLCAFLLCFFVNNDASVEVKSRRQPLCSFVSFVVGLSILLSGCAGEPKHPTWKNATGAEQHERLMWQAIQRQRLGQRGTPSFAHIHRRDC